VTTDSSPEEVERYGARGYGIPLQMPRQLAGSAMDDRVIELGVASAPVDIGGRGI